MDALPAFSADLIAALITGDGPDRARGSFWEGALQRAPPADPALQSGLEAPWPVFAELLAGATPPVDGQALPPGGSLLPSPAAPGLPALPTPVRSPLPEGLRSARPAPLVVAPPPRPPGDRVEAPALRGETGVAALAERPVESTAAGPEQPRPIPPPARLPGVPRLEPLPAEPVAGSAPPEQRRPPPVEQAVPQASDPSAPLRRAGGEPAPPSDPQGQPRLRLPAEYAPESHGPARPAVTSPAAPADAVSATAVTSAASTLGGVALDAPAAQWTQPAGSPLNAVEPGALAGRIHWMLDHRVGEARLKLNPPELGALDIRIALVDDKAYVQLSATQVGVTDLLEAALPRLRELLNAGGLELAGATVSHEGGRSASPPPGPAERLEGPAAEEPEPTPAPPAADAGRIDVYA